ncbi:hypothetical protein Bca52824_039349 [Brassica carinata]|uniref:Uncharacterized protein n=1 Tax=Brassica carinata TaxID=52824 RepID=A0A8X7UUI0_BRACI|nr:hypothetical protein Bca52824_039349 [Brassica carinata]
MRLKSRPGKQHVEQSFSSRLAQNLMEAFYVKKQKNAHPHNTNNVKASLDDEYAQVFGPECPRKVRCVYRGPTDAPQYVD